MFFYIVLTPISTTSGLRSTGNTRKYHQIDVYIYQFEQGISEPIFYGDLVYKFKQIVGKPNFSDQFKKIIKHYVKVGYNFDGMRQSACLVLNPITVYSYGFLFNYTTVGQALDSMTALTKSFNQLVGA